VISLNAEAAKACADLRDEADQVIFPAMLSGSESMGTAHHPRQGFVKVRLTVCHRWGEFEVPVGGFRPSLAVTLSCRFLGAGSAAIVTRA
jgi:hypothetical protein